MKRRSWRRSTADVARLGLVAVLALVMGACAGSDDDAPAQRQELRVLAASSLTEAFTELEQAFERAHPDVAVTLSFGASSTLVEQVAQGAPADVLVTADAATMQRAAAGGDVGRGVEIARNELVIVVEKANPEGIARLEDLQRPELDVVLCAPPVPCGRLAAALLAARRIELAPRSLEPDVKAVVARVAQGEADAGLAYRTDALAAAFAVDAVDAGPQTEQAVYVAAITARSSRKAAAKQWLTFLRSPAAQKRLQAQGFLRP